MSEPFFAEIVMFAGNFAPRGWALCDGQILSISQYSALFSLLGTTYGGDGRTTFGLPDLRGRVPIHPGNGPGLSPRRLGEKGGTETVALTVPELPEHTHQARCVSNDGNVPGPVGARWSDDLGVSSAVYNNVTPANANMAPDCISNTGNGLAHNNMQPFLAVNFIIALSGLYPSRS